MIIFTHRGLEPSNPNACPESSYEAFENHIKRGFGIEFDLNFTKNRIVIFHDADLKRITNGKDIRTFKDMSIKELKSLRCGKLKKGRISTFKEILELIKNRSSSLNALHLRGTHQEEDKLDLLIQVLKNYKEVSNKILIFDIKPETAKYLKSKIPDLKLAPSVAHLFDIKRYNSVVNGTLMSLDEALKYKKEKLYEWVWLDEWDTLNEKGEKRFYTRKVFNNLRKEGYKIALVTPELHRTSPSLVGRESHKDAINIETLFARIKEIILLKPDAICTDYPEQVRKFIN